MAKQPEGKLSAEIMKSWRKLGIWCYKVHGSMYQPSGIPDICGVAGGLSIWCETKMPGNRPSAIQWFKIDELRAHGALVVVAYNLEDAVALAEHALNGHTAECVCRYTERVQILKEAA